jgi:hypothetical protein
MLSSKVTFIKVIYLNTGFTIAFISRRWLSQVALYQNSSTSYSIILLKIYNQPIIMVMILIKLPKQYYILVY